MWTWHTAINTAECHSLCADGLIIPPKVAGTRKDFPFPEMKGALHPNFMATAPDLAGQSFQGRILSS